MFRKFRVCTLATATESAYISAMMRASHTTVEVVPNGVDCQHNKPGLAKTNPTALVFSGALTYGANFDAMKYFLSEIYPGVRRQVGNVSLTLTGNALGVRLTDLPR